MTESSQAGGERAVDASYNRAREMADEVMAELEATSQGWDEDDIDRISGSLLPRVYDCLSLLAMTVPSRGEAPTASASGATPVAAVAQPVAEDDPYYNLLGVIADAKAGNFNSVCVETLERVAAALAASPSCERQDVGGGK